MDDLTTALATSFQVSNNSLTTDAPHPRFSDLYKNRGKFKGQEERRRKMLELQKQKRFDYLSHVRRLVDNDWQGYDEVDADQGIDEDQMDYETSLPKPGHRYKNQLMLSEWMMEVPIDFTDEWLMVACPVGKRALVVASRGKTHNYTKSGYRVSSFPSHLPGGSRSQSGPGSMSTDSTILDCIYCEKESTFFVLDVMCWNGHPVMDSETEFRFFWMLSKLQECPEASSQSSVNPYKFVPLMSCPCSQDLMSQVLNSDLPYELDGILFYHKRTHYLFGVTPLVLWLKAYMVPELLGVKVHNKYMQDIPSTYTCFGAHIEQVKRDKEENKTEKTRRNPKVKNGSDKMDTTHTDSVPFKEGWES